MSGFQEDQGAARQLNATMGKRILGLECPLRNGTGDICRECERVKAAWRAGDAENEKWARDHQAKESYFLSVQKRDGEFTVLKIGKKVAKALKSKLEKYKARHGKPFGFANPEHGEWCAIEKEGEHPNFEYTFELLGEPAEAVSVDQIKRLPSLGNLTEDYANGALDIDDISSIGSGDAYEFRMVPIPTDNGKATEMIYRYYHWRCSEAEILGGDVGSVVGTGGDTPEEFKEFMTVGDDEDNTPAANEKYTMDEPPGCFGHYDADDDDCASEDCDEVRDACKAKAKAKKKPKK